VALEVLQKYSNDPLPEVAETCQLAIDRINWCIEHGQVMRAHPVLRRATKPDRGIRALLTVSPIVMFFVQTNEGEQRSKYHSVDPAPSINLYASTVVVVVVVVVVDIWY
jgi:hypothetical protein